MKDMNLNADLTGVLVEMVPVFPTLAVTPTERLKRTKGITLQVERIRLGELNRTAVEAMINSGRYNTSGKCLLACTYIRYCQVIGRSVPFDFALDLEHGYPKIWQVAQRVANAWGRQV